MLLRASRLGSLALLVALAAIPATMADAAASHPTIHSAATRARSRAKTARAPRRARRGPRGVVYARQAIVVDPQTERVLFAKDADAQVPIASLTKLMTVQVFLEQRPDLRRVAEVTMDEIRGGGHTRLRNHEKVSLYDLLHMSLMCSDNVATRVLERESGLSHGEFVDHMNDKARDLGLERTRFVEATGLDERNVSTATEIAQLLQAAAKNELLRGITTTTSYVFVSGRRTHRVVNTNRLLKSRYEVNCGKTGFISESGYCVATWIRAKGRDLVAVVLGAPTNATRFADVVRLVQHTTTTGFAETRQ
jgi:D-alanyl-D-alanine endopeptidase (penicillin-binding protein 7)